MSGAHKSYGMRRDHPAGEVESETLVDEFREKLLAWVPSGVAVLFGVGAPQRNEQVAVFLRHFTEVETQAALRQMVRTATTANAIDAATAAALHDVLDKAGLP